MSEALGAALITGGGGGIGAACARRFAELGRPVVVADYRLELAAAAARDVEAAGGRALPIALDVASQAEIEAAAAAAVDEFGRLDVLVTAAGHLDMAPVLEMEPSRLARMLDVHLKGTILCVQEAARRMREHGFGRIVCVSSVGALQGHAGAAHYTAAKAGILGFVNSACRELGPFGITINSVLPGAIDTPMIRQRDEATRERMAQTPVGRMGMPEDIAHAVAFLTSREAAYVNGAALIVGGGAYT